jgi:Flp pilus assembly protein TadB
MADPKEMRAQLTKEYNGVRADYKEIITKLKANVAKKKELRAKIKALPKMPKAAKAPAKK